MNEGWSGRRVLVTGATGLVGSWLVRDLLERGAQVACLVRDWDPQSELIRSGDIGRTAVVQGRLEDYTDVERAINHHEVDTVFHLGAQTIVGAANRSPLATLESNVRGTYNLLEACRVHASMVERILVASSDKAYGTAPHLPYREDMPPLGEHPYDVSKACGDLVARAYHVTYGLPVVTARCGNIYGGGDLNWSRIVPGTIRSLLRGESPIVRSDGRFTRDYVYVLDAVHAYVRMAEESHRNDVTGEVFNFGPRDPTDVLTIVRRIQDIVGRTDLEPTILDEATAEIRDQYLSSDKAERILGWEPRFSLEEGLEATIGWYRRYLGSAAG